jgi:phosphohistidine phosphatase
MRRLMLLRHAKTERAEPGERDRDRRLTKRGRADAPVIGAYMARHGLTPDLAIVSPARRAQETWTLLAAAFAKAPRVAEEERIYNANTDSLIEVIGETRAARSLLIVGHNPGLHDLAVQLIASGNVEPRQQVAEKLPTSGLVVGDLAGDDTPGALRHAAPDHRRDRLVITRFRPCTNASWCRSISPTSSSPSRRSRLRR